MRARRGDLALLTAAVLLGCACAARQPSSRTHASSSVSGMADQMHSPSAAVVSEARRADQLSDATEVLPGIDVLARRAPRDMVGKRCGLITNLACVGRDGKTTLEKVATCGTFRLQAVFAPEHGLGGIAAGEVLDSLFVGGTWPPVHSLHGERTRPTKRQLADLDLLLFDLPDVGVRCYTYISTMFRCMEVAADVGLPFVVLDRPNPLGGVVVEGPVLEPPYRSFVGIQPIAFRHGMTVGELARLFNGEFLHRRVKLRVVPVVGWRREMLLTDTRLPWRRPSPGLKSPMAVLTYPAICLFEGTNVSVGRGTDASYQVIGAPWMDGARLCRKLRGCRLAGIDFAPVEFRPSSSIYSGQRCSGLRLRVVDGRSYRATATGVALLWALRTLWPSQFAWTSDHFVDLLAGTGRLRTALDAGRTPSQIEALWAEETRAFKSRRQPYLLYR